MSAGWELFPARESLASDVPAGDGKNDNLFYSVRCPSGCCSDGPEQRCDRELRNRPGEEDVQPHLRRVRGRPGRSTATPESREY
jgi:hypothetical protein